MNNKYILGLVAVLLVGVGIGYVVKPAPATAPTQQVFGAAASPDHYNEEHFYNGLTYNKLGEVNTAVSTTTPALFKNATGGFFTISAGSTTFTASTTAIDTNTDIQIQQISTSTTGSSLNATLLSQLVGRTCNTTIATGTLISLFASTTNPSLNAFTVTVPSAPATNPACFSWSATGY